MSFLSVSTDAGRNTITTYSKEDISSPASHRLSSISTKPGSGIEDRQSAAEGKNGTLKNPSIRQKYEVAKAKEGKFVKISKKNPVKQYMKSTKAYGSFESLPSFMDPKSKPRRRSAKTVRHAPGFYEGLDEYQMGPDVIENNLECTPLPLWLVKDALPSFSTLDKKDSTEIVPFSPKESMISLPLDIRLRNQIKSPPMEFTVSLTTLEEAEVEKAEGGSPERCPKLLHNLNVNAEPEQVYITKTAKILKPDGTFEMKPRIRVILNETPTTFTIQLRGKIEREEDVETAKQVLTNNERYLRMVQHHRESDAYSDKFAQTFENRTRDQWTEYKSPVACDIGCQVNSYTIDDELKAFHLAEKKRLQKEEAEQHIQAQRREAEKEVVEDESEKSKSGSEASDDEGKEYVALNNATGVDWQLYEADFDDETEDQEVEEGKGVEQIGEEEFLLPDVEDEFYVMKPLEEVYDEEETATKRSLAKFPDISMDAVFLDRMVSMEYKQEDQAAMRGFPVIKFAEGAQKKKPHFFRLLKDATRQHAQDSLGPTVKRYWSLKCAQTRGRQVTDIALHSVNGNIVAVAYGSYTFGYEETGVVCLWSGKNAMYPERIYEQKSGATAVAFSNLTPYLLAVGLIDGNIVIYDVRSSTPLVVSSTIGSVDKHEGAVWQLVWFQEAEMATKGTTNEFLLSMSADGRVNRWLVNSKGFDSLPLLRVRKSPLKIPGRRENRAEGLTSSLAAPFCMVFYPGDWTRYLVGSDEGFIHKCSTALTEQYLGTYIGHTGPVYRIEFSRFDPTIFVSASGDWSVKFWKEGIFTPLLSLQTGFRSVFDIALSSICSSIVVAVGETELQVWDLTLNTLEPVTQYKPPKATLFRRTMFSSPLNTLILGDDDGAITLFGLQNFPVPLESLQLQMNLLNDIVLPGKDKARAESSAELVSASGYYIDSDEEVQGTAEDGEDQEEGEAEEEEEVAKQPGDDISSKEDPGSNPSIPESDVSY